MDVEGFEPHVLQGGERFLTQARIPFIVFEIGRIPEERRKAVLKFFYDLGYLASTQGFFQGLGRPDDLPNVENVHLVLQASSEARLNERGPTVWMRPADSIALAMTPGPWGTGAGGGVVRRGGSVARLGAGSTGRAGAGAALRSALRFGLALSRFFSRSLSFTVLRAGVSLARGSSLGFFLGSTVSGGGSLGGGSGVFWTSRGRWVRLGLAGEVGGTSLVTGDSSCKFARGA